MEVYICQECGAILFADAYRLKTARAELKKAFGEDTIPNCTICSAPCLKTGTLIARLTK